jgi:hypothetical protein
MSLSPHMVISSNEALLEYLFRGHCFIWLSVVLWDLLLVDDTGKEGMPV